MNDILTKLFRHGLAALAGYLGSKGFAPEGLLTGPLLGSLLCFGVSSLWSYVAQTDISATAGDAVRSMAASVAQQLVAALAGWIQAHGGGAEIAADPVALALFGANYAVSSIKRVPPPGTVGQWLIIALMPMMSLSCVTQQSTQAEVARAQAAVEAASFIVELAEIYWQSVKRDPKQSPAAIAAAEKAFREATKRLDLERARLAAIQATFALPANPLLPPPAAPAP
jgi:hypothetical protein